MFGLLDGSLRPPRLACDALHCPPLNDELAKNVESNSRGASADGRHKKEERKHGGKRWCVENEKKKLFGTSKKTNNVFERLS